jgi:hypothetical protein
MQKGVGVYKTEGIILKSAPLGEADLLLTLYTRGYGKIMARAISARKKEAKLKGYLQTFSRGNFLLAKSRTIDIVTDVENAVSYNFLKSNLSALSLAYYFSELVDKLTFGPERDENVWRLLARAFEVLNHQQSRCHSEARGRGTSDECRPAYAGDPSGFAFRMTEKENTESVDLQKIKELFEDKLLEFLGHPTLKLRMANHPLAKNEKLKDAQRLNYFQELAGEQINSQSFLSKVMQ